MNHAKAPILQAGPAAQGPLHAQRHRNGRARPLGQHLQPSLPALGLHGGALPGLKTARPPCATRSGLAETAGPARGLQVRGSKGVPRTCQPRPRRDSTSAKAVGACGRTASPDQNAAGGQTCGVRLSPERVCRHHAGRGRLTERGPCRSHCAPAGLLAG